MTGEPDLRQEVSAALDRVVDPCSVGRHVPAGLVEMGMVQSLELVEHPDGTDVAVTLQLTSPGCHFQVWFNERVESELRQVADVGRISIVWSKDFTWSDDSMSPSLKARMKAKREAVRKAALARGALDASSRAG